MPSVPDLVIDTNVLISSLIGRPATAPIVEALFAGRCRLITSDPLLDELRHVCSRPKIAKYFDVIELAHALTQLETDASIVAPTELIRACRDLKDNALLEAAVSGGAEMLVTGDKDLLALDPFRGISIKPPSHFMTWLAHRMR